VPCLCPPSRPWQLDASSFDGQALHEYPTHTYNVFTEPGACDYQSTPYTWTNTHADPGLSSAYSHINVADGQSLGRGPEFYNNMAAPNNCVGGSETSCPNTAPVQPPAPAHWYANGHNISIADGQSLGRGPEFYNNMAAPNNCIGGSETSCPNTAPVQPPAPAHWYANGHNISIADGQSLRGAEFYNNQAAPHNCVGGGEATGCSPPGFPVPRGPEFYNCQSCTAGDAVGNGIEMTPAKELALPAAFPAAAATEQGAASEAKAHKANPGHLLLSCHAFTLAAIDSVLSADFDKFDDKVTANAEAVTPVGAALLRQHVFSK